MKYILFLLWIFFSSWVFGQTGKLPELNLDRRADTLYVDSLIQVGLSNWHEVSLLKSNLKNDTLKLNALAYLPLVYRARSGKRDSALFYAQKLIALAHEYRQPRDELKGLYLAASYYQVNRPNFPKALQFNHEAIQLIEQNNFLKPERWKFRLSLGEILIALEQYQKALNELQLARLELEEHRATVGKNYVFYHSNILQQIGNSYRRLTDFSEAERHLLDAIEEIKPTQSATSLYYLYSDLGELYSYYRRYEQAISSFLKAEKESARMKNRNMTFHVWSSLAQTYCFLKNYDQAIVFAEKAMVKGTLLVTDRQCYDALYQSYQAKEQWDKAFFYYKKFNNISDTLSSRRKHNESIFMQNQFELDQLALHSRQAQQLQAQKLVAFQKQVEIEKLKANAEKIAFLEKTEKAELQRSLETAALKAAAQQAQQKQQQEINKLKINELNQKVTLQNRTRNFLLTGLGLLSFLGLILFHYNQRLRTANIQLIIKNREIEEAFGKGQSTERKRVSADLHDEIGSALSTIAIFSDLTKRKAQKTAPELVSELERIGAKSREMIQTMRDTIWTLNEDNSQNLWDRMQQYGIETLAVKNIELDWQIPTNAPEAPFTAKRNLFLAYKEALNNIVKHAEATVVRIKYNVEQATLQLIITDNGKGFDCIEARQQGNGLRNFEERMKEIGGKINIESNAGKGTVLAFTMPLHIPTPALS
ncbi:tetratricopeptide repeat-containing sensor histidine kinase [Runella sp.]|uniref:tetratricopeptide repeat-containing sensor histidine kinase n=1 Tax=Runella sp. TaxID=1960881 RepID=UPI003D0AB9C3